MLEFKDGRPPVHIPANPDKFEFDHEVAGHFHEMARASIPNFLLAHRMHASLAEPWLQKTPSVLDIGASRGMFITALTERADQIGGKFGNVVMTDTSDAMVEHLDRDFPEHAVIKSDVSGDAQYGVFDIVSLNYVMQFIRPELQVRTLRKVARMVKPGGVLFLGQKEKDDTPVGRALHEQYIMFRIRNGYTRDEIEKKNAALAGMHFPMEKATVMSVLREEGFDIRETTRHTIFATYMCVKENGYAGR